MLTFVLKRLGASVIPLLIVTFGVFSLARLTGDPSALYLPLSATPEERAAFAERHGFNEPIWEQFLVYLRNLGGFDFGTSLWTTESSLDRVIQAFPVTLSLMTVTLAVSLSVAIALGCLAAYRPNSVFDRAATLVSLVGASMPEFWFALMAILLFAVTLQWLPTSGTLGPEAWILPVLTLVIRPTGILTQVVRGEMISALSAPYVKVARSIGASTRQVIFNSALRNALIPAVTVAGDIAVSLLGGAVITETIFGWPGIGKLVIDSILMRDFAVLQTAMIVIALSIVLLNILLDVLYGLLDPRVRTAIVR